MSRAHDAMSVPNPILAPNPSYVADPDGILSASATALVNRLISDNAPDLGVQIGVAIVRQLLPKLTIATFVRELVNTWGIGDKIEGTGIMYALVLGRRKQHLFAGRGIKDILTATIRSMILKEPDTLRHLRSGDVDAAVINTVKNIIWRVRWQPRIFKLTLAMLLIVIGTMFWSFLRAVSRWRKRRQLRERLRERLREARQQLERMDVQTQIRGPCCVCIEPLLEGEASTEHSAEAEGGEDGVGSEEKEASGCTFDSITAEDFVVGEDVGGEETGAVWNGVELFKCGHLLHSECASQCLAVRDACPLCRLPHPRIALATAALAVPVALEAARASRIDWEQWENSVDILLTQRDEAEASSNSIVSEAISWGGGDADDGEGTTTSW